MFEETSYLARNIRFLRKQNKLSQQKLATALGIKRSNIAAYETKNVEPRLSLISKMAQFFNVSLADLITLDLEQQTKQETSEQYETSTSAELGIDHKTIEQFTKRAEEMRKMLEGFQVFYEYRKHTMQKRDAEIDRLPKNDVENFLIFIDQIISYNEEIFTFLQVKEDTTRQPQSRVATLAS